jgi:hypothetical protein
MKGETTMRQSIFAAVLIAGATAGFPAGAAADMLISEAEAKLPPSSDVVLTTRGMTRGPGVEVVSPDPDRSVASPLPLKIKFIARNNVAIDPASVKLFYVKAQSVDLTERIKKHLTANGIDMDQAEIPPGTHLLRINLADSQGRTGTATIRLTVAPK